MEANAVRKKINDYILQNTTLDSLDYDLDIFDEGLVSSLFAIELMTFLEKNFALKVTMEDLDMENFKSVNRITQFIEYKTAGAKQ
jgi:acyl carrier protein